MTTETTQARDSLFKRHIALPQQHGAWAIWLAPYLIGLGVGRDLNLSHVWLTLAASGAFLALQPLVSLVKVQAGRRPARDRRPALVWLGVYGLVVAVGALGLLVAGAAWPLALAVLALPVLAWQMLLVARRSERGQMGVEILGAAVLSLGAPAAYGVAVGGLDATAFWLWALCAAQAAGAVVYIFATLVYRRLTVAPPWAERWRIANTALLLHAALLLGVAALVALDQVPFAVLLPFSLLLAEAIYGGLLRPPVGVKPAVIGVRQTVVTAVFAALLIAAYWVQLS